MLAKQSLGVAGSHSSLSRIQKARACIAERLGSDVQVASEAQQRHSGLCRGKPEFQFKQYNDPDHDV